MNVFSGSSRFAWRGLAVLALVARGVAPLAGAQTPHAVLPTPESVIGFPVGADYKLVTYDESIDYFERLAAASNRIKLITVGKTSNGKTWTVAIISSPANLAKLDHFRDINRSSRTRRDSPTTRRALAHEGRAFVDISGGLHASEIAGSQHTILLAYDILRARTSRRSRRSSTTSCSSSGRRSIPTVRTSSSTGTARTSATPYRLAAARHELYQKYVGHDNNRDAYMLNVVESRVVARTWREWEPTSSTCSTSRRPSPRASGCRRSPTRSDSASRADVARSEHDRHDDRRGARTRTDSPAPYAAGHVRRVVSRATSTTCRCSRTSRRSGRRRRAATARRRASTRSPIFPPNYQDLRPTSLYPSPWAEGSWRLRDAMDYMRTARPGDARLRHQVPRRTALESLSGGAQHDQQFRTIRRTRTSFRSSSATPGAGRAAAPPRVHRRAREPARPRHRVRRREVSRGHLGDSDGPGVRAARARAVRAAEVSGWANIRRHAVRRRRMDTALSDGRARRRGNGAASCGLPRRA